MSDFHTPEASPFYGSVDAISLPISRSIDWTKVRTVEDVVAVLQAMRITVADPSPQADALRPYLVP